MRHRMIEAEQQPSSGFRRAGEKTTNEYHSINQMIRVSLTDLRYKRVNNQ